MAAETGTEGSETIAKPVVTEEAGGVKQDWSCLFFNKSVVFVDMFWIREEAKRWNYLMWYW